MEGYLSGHRYPFSSLFLYRLINLLLPKDTKLEHMVSESVEPSFLEAPSGA